MIVGFDVELLDKKLARPDRAVRIGKIGSSTIDALDFRSHQNNPSLVGFLDVIVISSPPILNGCRTTFLGCLGLSHERASSLPWIEQGEICEGTLWGMQRVCCLAGLFVTLLVAGCGAEKDSAETKVGDQEAKSPTTEPLNKKPETPEPPKTDAKVKVEDVKVGQGKAAADGDLLLVTYRGTLRDGKVFDSNDGADGKPFAVKLGAGGVIRGWEQGLLGMKVGGIRKLDIPAVLAYGSREMPGIPANSDLLFEIKLLDMVPKGEELVYDKKVIKEGSGPVVKRGDTVTVHYTGKLVNGFQFDSSIGKKPFSFRVGDGQVIQGWDYGIEGMKVGSKFSLRLPPATAYGPGGQGDIPGNQVLLFDIEILKKE